MIRTDKLLVSIVVILSALLVFTNIDELRDFTGNLAAESRSTSEIVDLDLFAMSMCPHCVDFETSLARVQDALGDNTRFRIFYVMKRNDDGIPTTPRGYPETVENARQLCIYHQSPGRLFDYLNCMAGHYQSPENAWEACASGSGIDVEQARSCFDGEEGRELLWHNTFMAEYLGIESAPRLLINDEMYTGKRNPNSILAAVCGEFRDKPEACFQDLESTGLTGLVIGTPSEGFCTLD